MDKLALATPMTGQDGWQRRGAHGCAKRRSGGHIIGGIATDVKAGASRLADRISEPGKGSKIGSKQGFSGEFFDIKSAVGRESDE